MICPKCDKESIKKIIFKKSGDTGYLCNTCKTVWLAGETISLNSGHLLHALTKDDDMEYTYSIDESADEIKEDDDDQVDEEEEPGLKIY